MPIVNEYFAGATFTRYCPQCKGEKKHSSLLEKGEKPHTLKDAGKSVCQNCGHVH